MKLDIVIPQQDTSVCNKVKNSLQTVVKIFRDLTIEYRILGSIIPAAILERLHRALGDIDILIDKNDLRFLIEKLKGSGYKVKKRRIKIFDIIFSWVEAEKRGVSPLTIFLGYFDKDKNFIVPLSKNLKLLAENKIIRPTKYSLFHVKFIGIPRETAYLGVYRSRFNPKRKFELPIMKSVVDSSNISYKKEVGFYYKETKVPFFGAIYNGLQLLRNIIGKIRICFGKPYDFWQKGKAGLLLYLLLRCIDTSK